MSFKHTCTFLNDLFFFHKKQYKINIFSRQKFCIGFTVGINVSFYYCAYLLVVNVIGFHSLVQLYIVITLPVFDKFAAFDFIGTTLLSVDRAKKVLQQIV